MDLRQFGRKMHVTGEVIDDNVGKLVRKVALAVDASVVLATPVDTGRARSNWQVELNEAPTGEVETLAGVRKGFSGSGSTVARASIEEAKRIINEARPTDTIHITNNLPYIARLNEGWSAQAPANFVEESVMVGVKQIKGAKITIERGVK